MEKNKLNLWIKYRKLSWKYGKWTQADNPNNKIFTKIEWYIKNRKTYIEERREFEKIVARRHQAMKRYRNYIKGMFENYCTLYWVTFTIEDHYIERDTKRKLKQWLNEHTKDYICNEDFGEKKGRKHFHAILATKDNYFTWKIGNIDVKEINIRRGPELLTKYANKFSNHATKSTTQKTFHKRGMKEIEIIKL